MSQYQSSIRRNKNTQLVDKGNKFVPPLEQIKNVVVVPFIAEDKLVCGFKNAQITLPSRCTQIYDLDCFDTVQRELRESVGIITGELKLLKVLASDYYGTKPEQLAYIVVFATIAEKFLYSTSNLGMHCRLGRKVVSLETFFREHKSNHQQLVEEIVITGRQLAFDSSPRDEIMEKFKLDRLEIQFAKEQAQRRARKSWLYDNPDYAAGVSLANSVKQRGIQIYY